MTTIILITAALRVDNLPYIADSIAKRFKESTMFKPFWMICYDRYHADLSEEKRNYLDELLNNYKIDHQFFFEGENQETNYGGALMNKPLLEVKENKFKDENPLVYILDDDNIIHPNFIYFLEHNYIENDNVSYWLNMVDEFGSHIFSRYADALAFRMGTGLNEGYRITHPCASCDPSQLVIRLNKLIEIGLYDNIRLYDFKLMDKLYHNWADVSKNMIYQGDHPWIRNHEFYNSCYHNGLVTKELVSDTIRDLSENFSDTKKDSYIRIHTNNHNLLIELTNEEVLEILEKKEAQLVTEEYDR